jgi:hypothetical protein
MDRKFQQNQEVERLIQAAQVARSCLEVEAIALRQRLDIPSRIRASLKRHPTGWLVGSAVSGFAASLIFGRRPVAIEKKRRSFPIAVLGLTLTAVRPLAKVWLADQLKSYLTRPSVKPLIRRMPPSGNTSSEIL